MKTKFNLIIIALAQPLLIFLTVTSRVKRQRKRVILITFNFMMQTKKGTLNNRYISAVEYMLGLIRIKNIHSNLCFTFCGKCLSKYIWNKSSQYLKNKRSNLEKRIVILTLDKIFLQMVKIDKKCQMI